MSNFFAKQKMYKQKKLLADQMAVQSTDMQSTHIVKPTASVSVHSTSFFTPEYRTKICTNSYLGKKGYTIPKELLAKEDLDFLYKDLYCKPVLLGPAAATAQDNAFPVYKENAKKIYIPRFYGIERYGLPDKSEIEYGETIDVPFEKPLRDYQDKIIDVYIKHVTPSSSGMPSGGGILEVPCGRGKCLAKDTQIVMYDGSIKLVQDVLVGDVLMGDDSLPRNVLSLARGREIMYKVKYGLSNELSYTVNESHILSLYQDIGQDRDQNLDKDQNIVDISVLDYLKLPETTKATLKGYRVPVEFLEKPIHIDPYLMGYEIGNDALFYTRIPSKYKCNTHQIRLAMLAGIIDYSGQYHKQGYEIIQKNQQVVDDIIFVARSLGYCAYKSKSHKLDKTGLIEVTYYRTKIYGNGIEHIPTKLVTMTDEPIQQVNTLHYDIQLQKLKEDDYYGFEIDGNRRFVLGDFTVTHNTVMALKIISLLRQKTLIIVHKEFLMNQWIERIGEFLPKAKVGKIQGPTFDIEGKDIVLGMLQTLYDRDFSNVGQNISQSNINNPFSSFGLTIIDEVHRIGSEQFSKTLLRVITPYMLGISATVERKDKLTKVLYMFIGPKIYTEKREDEDLVCVRAINYTSQDKEFNEVVQDFRGNTQYSSMITKLCAFGPRCDFIVRVIADLVEESLESQIMILAHNRSLLTYFHEAIQHKQIASVGFYVGGMKQKNLQETESKQIVLATYAMAAEALDIKTLSTLIMATPKTDIIQSVGRILRVRHDKPIVVDIVDSHDIFRNQWKQRKSFYKKCNYRIRSIESVNYKDMMIEWPMTVAGGSDLTWTRVFEPKSVDKSVDKSVPKASKTKIGKTDKSCIVKATSIQINDNHEEEEEESEDEMVKPSFGCMIDLGDLQDEDYI